MSSIIIATMPIHGHVTPLLPVARYFAERGDRVRFLTGSRFASLVEATGAQHLPLPADADFDDRQDFNETFPERAALKGTKAVAHDLEHIFVRPGLVQHDTLMALHAAEPADVALLDPAFLGGAFLLGHHLGARPPIVMAGFCPLPISSRDTAPFGMGLTPIAGPLGGPLGRLRNAVLAMVTRKVVFPPVERAAGQIFDRLHGRAIPFPVLDWARHAEAIAQFTVPAFEYPRSDAPANLHFTGPIAGPSSAAGSQVPLPSWWHELDGSCPLVHLTQGTIANKDYGQLIAPALQALADEDVLVAVATGGRPVESLPPLPANARAAEFLPYDHLLPKTDVYVTNGGYGGVQYALRHGVPIVAAGGSQEDKPEVLARIAWSGVGRRIKTNTPTPAAIRKAVRTVLHDQEYRDAARRLAEQIAASRGIHGLADIVEDVTSNRPQPGLRERQP